MGMLFSVMGLRLEDFQCSGLKQANLKFES